MRLYAASATMKRCRRCRTALLAPNWLRGWDPSIIRTGRGATWRRESFSESACLCLRPPQSRDRLAPGDRIGDLAGRNASMFQLFMTPPNQRRILITAYCAKNAFCKGRGRRRDVGESNYRVFFEIIVINLAIYPRLWIGCMKYRLLTYAAIWKFKPEVSCV